MFNARYVFQLPRYLFQENSNLFLFIKMISWSLKDVFRVKHFVLVLGFKHFLKQSSNKTIKTQTKSMTQNPLA